MNHQPVIGEHEADAAAEHAADPHVVAAGARHRRDQRRIGDALDDQVARPPSSTAQIRLPPGMNGA